MRAGLCVYQLDVGAKLDCWIVLSLTLEIDDAELAMLGGYLARSSDPSPGAVTFCLLLIPPVSSGMLHLLGEYKRHRQPQMQRQIQDAGFR